MIKFNFVLAGFLMVCSQSYSQEALSPGPIHRASPNQISSRVPTFIGAEGRYQKTLDEVELTTNLTKAIQGSVGATTAFSSEVRGVRDAALFRTVSPSVVLIVTKDSLGTGTLVSTRGEILTNWHVVGDSKKVSVIFKPERDSQKVSDSDVREGVVTKVDQIADLATIVVANIPKGRNPVKIGGDSDVGIGLDVHAIGHPRGESWTYTKGVISQFRNSYKWGSKDSPIKHEANVIQTQTPINPGNSGGPLFLDSGLLIGVNSFKEVESEGLNFAVAADDVKAFLNRKSDRLAPVSSQKKSDKCDWKIAFEGRGDDGAGDLVSFDTKCNGTVNVEVYTPDDKSKAVLMNIDRNIDSKIDLVLFSYERDWKWNLSLWDDDFDGIWDRVGYHKDGEFSPFKFESYATFKASLKK